MNPSTIWDRVRTHRFGSTLAIVLTLAIGILIGTVITHGVKGKEQNNPSADATPLQMPSPQKLSTAFTQIAKAIEPSVVNINSESLPKKRRPGMGSGSPPAMGPGQGDDSQDPFQDFFRHFFGGQGGDDGGVVAGQRSLGSGVIVDPKGYIITNAHVIDGADRIRVNLMNETGQGQGHPATVIGVDKETDIAVIKIDPGKTPLVAAKLGNSDSVDVGSWVLAIGSPFGLQSTVTAGIVSAMGRNIVPNRQFQSFIQTDAAINPGNSGGPLVDMAGEVIGINTAIVTGSYGSEGVGFAMPINVVRDVYNQLIGPEHRVLRGSIGVSFEPNPNPALSKVYGVDTTAIIAAVRPASPADQAGLKVGDAVTAVDGKTVKDSDDVVNDITAVKPGGKVTLSIVRNGQKMEKTVEVVDRAKLYKDILGGESEGGEEGQPTESKLGISIRSLSPAMAQQMGIPAEGVLVTEVRPGSFGDDLNLQRGDVILQVNRQPVNSEEEFNRIVSQLKSGDPVALLLRVGRGRNASTAFVSGTLP
jgi:serine protease Do